MEYLQPDKGTVALGGAVPVTGDLTIDQANAVAYDGKTLVWLGAYTLTLSAGLPAGFGFAARPPDSGDASIAAGSGVLLNSAGTTLTRALADNILFAVTVIAQDSYAVTGA